MVNHSENTVKAARFIIFFGIVSLFADMCYEGARSIIGPYLAILGASGTVVGFVAGLGELIGYTMRLVSGYVSDKTQRPWLFTSLGYTINLVSVPLLALATTWPMAASLIILERFGKALRTPPRDALLSYASHLTGRGWGFGVHEALDRTGAVLGPLLLTLIIMLGWDFQAQFAFLAIPAALALIALFVAHSYLPHPEELEKQAPHLEAKGLTFSFWSYVIGASLIGAGFVDFPLFAYHFQKTATTPEQWITLCYAISMLMAVFASIFLGRLYDKFGMSLMTLVTILCSLFAPLIFFGNTALAFLGLILWGIGIGIQGSVMRAIVAELVPSNKRGTAYGIFNTFFGIFWFLGSALMGYLYDISLSFLVAFSVLAQLAAIPFFIGTWKKAQ